MIIYSLEDLGKFYGLRPKAPKQKAGKIYCRKCGGLMKRHNNILICDNEISRTDPDGEEKTHVCNAYFIQAIRRTNSSLIPPGELPESFGQPEQLRKERFKQRKRK